MLKKIAFAAVILALASAVPTAGQQTGRVVTGTALLGYIETPTPPVQRYVGARVVSRGAVQIWSLGPGTDPALLPWLDGEITFVVNCNFSASYKGPCWGTFEWDVPGAEGVWVGTTTSPLMDLATYESRFSMVGHGVGGAIDGKQLRFDGGSAPGDWYITGTVRIQ